MEQKNIQPALFSPSRPFGQTLSFSIQAGRKAEDLLDTISGCFDPDQDLIGLGEPLLRLFPRSVPGLSTFPSLSGTGFSIPATQEALWILVLGKDRTEVFDRTRVLTSVLEHVLALRDTMETFVYDGGKDLTGYIDGTENPPEEDRPAVALLDGDEGLAGSSFVAVQRWEHDLTHFRSRSSDEQDAIIGRHRTTNEEMPEAPPSAHIRRSARESFSPPATLFRRSMPWARGDRQGLEFIAFSRSLSAFDRILRRMAGLDDGIPDALFSFSRPVTGGYYWCPPMRNGRLDLSWLRPE
ncbi:Dyp-type peroxidase [Leptospirillum ferriphilum]|jgi:putative iron-dependent peroxidase|uniref:Dyp-type peroxidase family n=2 Tax=Leptospirillum TaxID=179 RepID=A0A094WF30_9BACT|nr:Dyp-type peroxidase [Leptospirillum ferriphilum]EDZ38410.1 MAG: Probable Dyp-type peroxidase [Leptospirillum sp. Group II '5-way CG']KGA94247.1 Dyp-type peroxidase family [Leptospirillum ferriphilum]